MYAVDLHSHSRFFHAYPGRRTDYDPVGLRTLALVARARGLDAVVVTNHDYVYPERPRRIAGVTLLPGVEISTADGHVLAIGPDPPRGIEPDAVTAPDAVDRARDRGCATVLAHPFRGSRAKDTAADFDAVEINGKNPDHATATIELAGERDLPLVGGSDAHYPPEVGRVFTRLDCGALTPQAVASAIRDGRTGAVKQYGPLQRGVSAAYTLIHRAKGQL